MSKQEFMRELESLLSDIPAEEREEALRYYDGYFEDAGVEQEEEILKELGSPGKVARMIKDELLANADERKSRGYFTEKGYNVPDDSEDKYELINPSNVQDHNREHTENSDDRKGTLHQAENIYQNVNNNQSYYNQTLAGSNNTNKVLLILLAVCTSFIWLPLLLGAAGIVIGIAAVMLGLIFVFGIAGVCMMIFGISLIISGLIHLAYHITGALLAGGGLIILGIGMLQTLVFVIICKKLLPAMVRGLVNLCSRPFRKRRVMA